MYRFDHIMYAAADLQSGIDELEVLTGVRAVPGGSHPGMGTRNALLGLGSQQYLEIIAPDPNQDLPGSLGEALIQHGGSGIRSFAVATDRLAAVETLAEVFGFASRGLTPMSRTEPELGRLEWRLCFLKHRLLPFFIDWQASPHPSKTAVKGCSLMAMTVLLREPSAYREFISQLDLQTLALKVQTSTASEPEGFTATLMTPRGIVELPNWWMTPIP
ncbi:MAG: hypothetical protein CBC55_06110 [Gammaproteobacteria bacterium TMED95]|nr:hypothetical protein [Gammaproteobacteria bacterium]OUV21466.1 MAG: hypothetical protein CBC55_06110 [Gammaproteobacteria bacterium TMED95]